MMSTPKQVNEKKKITLNVIFPDRPSENIMCDSVIITVKDDEKGHYGGLYGIHYGHADSLFALDTGSAEAFADGKSVWKQIIGEGFASVCDNHVTLVTELTK